MVRRTVSVPIRGLFNLTNEHIVEEKLYMVEKGFRPHQGII